MTAGRWEEVSCPICPPGTGSDPNLTCSDRLDEPQRRIYRLVRCKGCGLIYLNPRPAPVEAGEFYRNEGYDPFISLRAPRGLFEKSYRLARRLTTTWKRRLVGRRVSRGGRILDVGCSTGEFIARLAKDYRCEGVEPEPEAAQWARERLGLKVYTGELSDAHLKTGSYDLVTLWHVLEHLPDPAGVLTEIHRLLAESGHLLIALPNIRSLDAVIYGASWVALDAPRHLWHFSPSQLKRLARQTGFRLTTSGMLPFDTFYNVYLSEKLCLDIHGWSQPIISPFRMTAAALGSLIWGGLTGLHSGKFYIFEKLINEPAAKTGKR